MPDPNAPNNCPHCGVRDDEMHTLLSCRDRLVAQLEGARDDVRVLRLGQSLAKGPPLTTAHKPIEIPKHPPRPLT